MASAFDELVETVEGALQRAQHQTRVISSGDKDAVRVANDEASKQLKEVERCLKNMDAEYRNSAPTKKRTMTEAITRLRQELAKVRQALSQANDSKALMADKADASKSPAVVFRWNMGCLQKAQAEVRDKLVSTTEKAARTTGKLEQAHTTLLETENIGVNVIDTMQQQREALIRSKTNVSDTSSHTDEAKRTVISMQRAALTNKFLLGGAVIVLLAMIGVVVYFGYIKKD